jgi:hypothetical protein
MTVGIFCSVFTTFFAVGIHTPGGWFLEVGHGTQRPLLLLLLVLLLVVAVSKHVRTGLAQCVCRHQGCEGQRQVLHGERATADCWG